jgi:hypothetical protein
MLEEGDHVLTDKLSNKISGMSSGIHRIDLDKILDLGTIILSIICLVSCTIIERDCLTRWFWLLMTCMVSSWPK